MNARDVIALAVSSIVSSTCFFNQPMPMDPCRLSRWDINRLQGVPFLIGVESVRPFSTGRKNVILPGRVSCTFSITIPMGNYLSINPLVPEVFRAKV